MPSSSNATTPTTDATPGWEGINPAGSSSATAATPHPNTIPDFSSVISPECVIYISDHENDDVRMYPKVSSTRATPKRPTSRTPFASPKRRPKTPKSEAKNLYKASPMSPGKLDGLQYLEFKSKLLKEEIARREAQKLIRKRAAASKAASDASTVTPSDVHPEL